MKKIDWNYVEPMPYSPKTAKGIAKNIQHIYGQSKSTTLLGMASGAPQVMIGAKAASEWYAKQGKKLKGKLFQVSKGK
jgi:hypothetical protein